MGYINVGDDEWKPPLPVAGAWEDIVQGVETIEKDDRDELWAFIIFNEKTSDGRFRRQRAKVSVMYRAAPQRVCVFFFSAVVLMEDTKKYSADAQVLRESAVRTKPLGTHQPFHFSY